MLFVVCCQTGKLGNRGHIKFPAQSTAVLLLKITLYQSDCLAVMHLSFIGSLGFRSYHTRVHFVVVLPLYGMGIVQEVYETFALNFYWVKLLSNCH